MNLREGVTYSVIAMTDPRFLRFTRSLALLGGAALTACSAPQRLPDAGSIDVAQVEANAPDTMTNATDGGPTEDVAQRLDVAPSDARDGSADGLSDGTAADVTLADGTTADAAPSDAGAGTDATAADALAPRDVTAADASGCPADPPRSGSPCATPGQDCSWSDPSMVTFCACNAGAWSCATAVPGPLPPPELFEERSYELRIA